MNNHQEPWRANREGSSFCGGLATPYPRLYLGSGVTRKAGWAATSFFFRIEVTQ